MIVYDLKCARDHVFEAWFKGSADFDAQAEAHEIACPVCGDTGITRALMAPNVAPRKGDKESFAAGAATMHAMLAEVRKEIEENCDYVGEKFPEEARRIHHGETEERPIYGEASPEEAIELEEEGIEVAPIPFMQRTDA